MAQRAAHETDSENTNGGIKMLLVDNLHGQHEDTFVHAIDNIMSSPIAKVTYGQIIDGLPLSSVARDRDGMVCPGHPLLKGHNELSPEVLERARQLRASFDPSVLQMNSRIIYAYRAASPGSRAFQTRLIELVAFAVHQIAVWLFNQEPFRPKDDPLLSWRPSGDLAARWYETGFPPTLFRHPWYSAYDQYPNGVADGVGYWTESRILGGVVLFDRREPTSVPEADPNAIYFHSDGKNVTYRIYRLLNSQRQQLLQFLLSDATPPSSCPIPIHGNLDNRRRVDPEEPIAKTGIYRDKWERRPFSADDNDRRLRDVIDQVDYVSHEEWFEANWRGMKMRNRFIDGISDDDDAYGTSEGDE